MEDNGEKLKPKVELTPNAKGALATGGGIVAFDVLTHAGPTGLLLAGIGTWIMARHTSDFIYQKDRLLAHFVRSHATENEHVTLEQDHSFADRLLGRHQNVDRGNESHASDERSLGDRLLGRSPNLKKNVTQPRAQEQVPNGTILIGTDTRERSVYRSWAQLKSVLILGLAGLGKSSTASWLVAQAIRDGASIVLIDKHGRSDESLTAMLAPFESFFVRPPAYRPDDAFKNAQFVSQELESRIEGDTSCDAPLVLVIDEFSDIMRQIKQGGQWKETGQELASLIEEINTQGRKYNVFVIAIGQITNASRSGGTEIRDLFNTRMLHAMRETQAQMVLPEYKQQVARLEKGQIFLDMEGRDEPFMVQVPLLSAKEMKAIASQCQTRLKEQLDEDDFEEGRGYDDEGMDPLPMKPPVVKYEPAKRPAIVLASKYDRAIQAWNDGSKSIRRLAETMELNFNQARDLINDMHNKGFINKYER
jgi:DNA segregation ATPase FtsK/SpoIIIE-like protein